MITSILELHYGFLFIWLSNLVLTISVVNGTMPTRD
jgi:hypothetical protein